MVPVCSSVMLELISRCTQLSRDCIAWFQCLPTCALSKQFALKELVRWGIECLGSATVQIFSSVINYSSQLSFTTVPFLNACCLSVRSLYSSRWAMIFEQTMCSSNLLASYTSQRNGLIITRESSVTLFKKGHIFAIIIIIITIITLFQKDNIFGTNASLIHGPQIQRHTCVS